MSKIFAIGDIHGCFYSFFDLLNKLGPSKEDEIILLGDLVDRGPRSKEVLDFVIDLKSDGFDIKCVYGNHEIMMMEALKSDLHESSWLKAGGSQTLGSFKIESTKGIPFKYFEMFKEFEFYFERGNYLLTHGGLNFKLNNPLEDTASMPWTRNHISEIDSDKIQGRKLVVGHTPKTQDEIVKSLDKKIIYLDGGLVFKNKRKGLGDLYSLELKSKKLFWTDNKDI